MRDSDEKWICDFERRKIMASKKKSITLEDWGLSGITNKRFKVLKQVNVLQYPCGDFITQTELIDIITNTDLEVIITAKKEKS